MAARHGGGFLATDEALDVGLQAVGEAAQAVNFPRQVVGELVRGTGDFGFDQAANLDDGNFWPTSFALTKLTKPDEARIAELVKKAVS